MVVVAEPKAKTVKGEHWGTAVRSGLDAGHTDGHTHRRPRRGLGLASAPVTRQSRVCHSKQAAR